MATTPQLLSPAAPPGATVWRNCWSQWNFSSFLVWFSEYATDLEQQEASKLYIKVHRSRTPPWMEERGIAPQHVAPQLRLRDNTVLSIRELPCQDVGCARCTELRGGYQFRWCDPRWTPQAVLDLTLTPDTVKIEMYKPWPRGMLPISPLPLTTPQDPPTAPQDPPVPPPQPSQQRRKGKDKHRNRGGPRTPSSASSSLSSNTTAPAAVPPAPTGPEAWGLYGVPCPSTTPSAIPLVKPEENTPPGDCLLGPFLV